MSMQTLCDTFVITLKLAAAGITYHDHHREETKNLFEAWEFVRHPNIKPPYFFPYSPPPETEEDESMIECGFTSSRC